jgi:ribonuclease P protein component
MSVNRHTFSKSEHLCGVNRVDSLFRDGSSFVCYPFRVLWTVTTAEEDPSVCFMVSVSKRKLKHAVDRNRVKRLMREAYRLNKQLLVDNTPKGSTFHVAFIWIPTEVLLFEKVSHKMRTSLLRLANGVTEKNVGENEVNNHGGTA